ncbi:MULTISPECIES: hypothetical protein [unclassified Pseudomonas]|uniref:hypothetical protein n=1 Tax=unclassified Pseudomonas TaxID=196821 RepID=UPI0010C04890|nr:MULTISPECIES: hypothetical protein [unclassified Pseudomonas]MBD8562125.1 hypothetical protein [Pseudomonas fluorescens]TKJ80488.1 hypothetical protein PspCFBP13509_09710 [Pseudomonas sp. CFBP13509]TKK29052.1 hypothetical protein PspCFBP13528_18790 [Pseudomonas sp. CFBP13528]
MSSGAVDQNLREREKIRRKALWALSDLLPGDPKATPVVSMLDEIARQDEADRLLRDVAKVEDLRDLVVTEPSSSGVQIVREGSIPEPWRERFLQASIGSTRVETGPFLDDFEKFINLWKQENQCLEAYRLAIGKKI